MPVAVLFCEGGPQSPDARVLSKLLQGRCTVVPMLGKYGMRSRIEGARCHQVSTYGLCDRDFDREFSKPVGAPLRFLGRQNRNEVHLGWRWERKEIENYLIDPEIVRRTLAPTQDFMDRYVQQLNHARDCLRSYQAARIVLSAIRPKFDPLPSGFGHPRGKDDHCLPAETGMESCMAEMMGLVAKYNETHSVDEDGIEERFEQYHAECCAGGIRYEHFLHAFAGKDILWSLDGWLNSEGHQGAAVFRERVLLGIARSSENIETWLPEWSALQTAVSE